MPTLPSSDDISMIRPNCWGIMYESALRIVQKACQKFQSRASCMASSVMSTTGAWSAEPPALGTRMSMRP